MARVTIPVAQLEFEEDGHTIWIHNPQGGTTMRIKTMGKIVIEECKTSPHSHCDIMLKEDINICLAEDS
jgi:hypothetical protein